MTDQEIIEMGIQADLCDEYGTIKWEYGYRNEIIAFAKLVAEKEREACNAICLDTYEWAENLLDQDEKHFAGRMRAAQDIGNAIRAREQA